MSRTLPAHFRSLEICFQTRLPFGPESSESEWIVASIRRELVPRRPAGSGAGKWRRSKRPQSQHPTGALLSKIGGGVAQLSAANNITVLAGRLGPFLSWILGMGRDALCCLGNRRSQKFSAGHLAFRDSDVLINGPMKLRCNRIEHNRMLSTQKLFRQFPDAFVGCHTQNLSE
jgi:hypothetical protein